MKYQIEKRYILEIDYEELQYIVDGLAKEKVNHDAGSPVELLWDQLATLHDTDT